ncbi:MAG: S46 family peptidase [Bacteroidales bacterium]
MIKRILGLLISLSIILSTQLRADEGMWLLAMIGKNYEDMQKAGFKLTPEDIYNINNSSIKDAIVGLGSEGNPFRHFCTGEIVSPQGLFFTNHHCGYGQIQAHSTLEHDYLKDGFWAYSLDQELINEGLTVSILVRMEDVTDKILAELNDQMTEQERQTKISEISKKIAKTATQDTYYDAYVADMFNSNQFFLFVYVIYKDVRLVGAPPSSMGKFGGDTDNWEWPRHTADFSMFRIYTAPDGKPAKYSKDNIPLKPKHHLPVSIKGVKEGDFAMVLGFPGTTDRYLTSFGLDETMNITNALRYSIRDVKVNILREEMQSDREIRIKYASKYARLSNYWKYSNEQNKALRKLNTKAVKLEIEAKYKAWAQKQSDNKYLEALSLIENAYKNRAPYAIARMYYIEGLISGPELPLFAYRTSNLLALLESKDQDKINTEIANLRKSAESFYKDYNPQTEKRILAAMFKHVFENLDKEFHPDFFENLIVKKYKGNFDNYADDVLKKSIFATKEKFLAFLDKPNAKTLKADMMFVAGNSIMTKYREINTEYWNKSEGLDKGRRLFVDGLIQMNPDKVFYPDANSTIRLTYGTISGYKPRDAVKYRYYTTLTGVLEKEDPNSDEFYVPQKLKDLYYAQDFGEYVNEAGELVTCFISNNDITGGNSGSPVINGEGHLIGIAFDGNSEAMSGDIDFEENLQRCINLDIRYALWIIDKYAGAGNLIDEMTIVK